MVSDAHAPADHHILGRDVLLCNILDRGFVDTTLFDDLVPAGVLNLLLKGFEIFGVFGDEIAMV